MKIDAIVTRTRDAFLALDDGSLMRSAFYTLLAAAAVFIVIDWREIRGANAALGYDPMQPETLLALPPALTEGRPQTPPSEVTSDPDLLKGAIRFELKSGGVLSAEGTIDIGAADRFAKEVELRGEYVRTVLLDSPGGSVGDALAISKMIRERKIGTKVAAGALCASSCPVVLAGGTTREVEPGAVIGVHQIFNATKEKLSPERAMSEAQKTTAEVGRHLQAMGIKPGLWFNALETPPDRLYYLTPEEMRAFALTTQPAQAAVKQGK